MNIEKKRKIKFPLLLCVIIMFTQIWQIKCLMKITKVICADVDPEFQKTAFCYLKALRRNVVAFYLQTEVLHKVTNCLVQVDWRFKKSNAYRNSLLNVTADACDIVSNRGQSQLLRLIYETFGPYSNLNHSCPYEGIIKIDGFVPEHAAFKLPIPSGEYRIKSKWIMNSALRFTLDIWFSFEEVINGRRTFEILQ